MLPRSFLSASSLKNGLEEISTSSNKRRRSTTYRKDVLESDSSTDSSSDSDNELPDIYETYSEAYLYNDIGALLNQIQHQQTKHRKHLKRAITLEKTIRKNTKKLSLLTRLLIKKQHQHQTLEPSLSPTNASLKIPAKRESRSNQLLSAPSIQVSPAPSTKIKATSSSLLMDTSEAEPSRRKHQITSDLAYKDSFDVLMRQSLELLKDGFDRKARRLLCNTNENITDQDMRDLMVSCTLNGELQFWNANDKRQIDKLDSGVIFKDTWVEDLCWTSPTTLTLAPYKKNATSTRQSVVILDLKSVKRTSVKGDIQTMASMPHDKGFESIASVDFGYQGGKALEERISFVTSGGDKTVCLWNLSRENRDDIFEEVIHPLEIKHTNRIHSLCMVKNTGILYTGGADFRLNAFDMKAERAVGELNLRHMIHDIQKNNTNPNYLLVTLAKSDGQFVIFDQRCSHPKGVSLLFGAHETDRMERYAKPDWHNNGYTVMCGSPAETRLNFWDIRYTNVEKGPSFTISLEAGSGKGHRVLQSVFLPNKGTTASVTSSRSLIWMDYRISPDCKPSTVL